MDKFDWSRIVKEMEKTQGKPSRSHPDSPATIEAILFSVLSMGYLAIIEAILYPTLPKGFLQIIKAIIEAFHSHCLLWVA